LGGGFRLSDFHTEHFVLLSTNSLVCHSEQSEESHAPKSSETV